MYQYYLFTFFYEIFVEKNVGFSWKKLNVNVQIKNEMIIKFCFALLLLEILF